MTIDVNELLLLIVSSLISGGALLKLWQYFNKNRRDDWTYLSEHYRKLLEEKDRACTAVIVEKDKSIAEAEEKLSEAEREIKRIKKRYLELQVKLAGGKYENQEHLDS